MLVLAKEVWLLPDTWLYCKKSVTKNPVVELPSPYEMLYWHGAAGTQDGSTPP